MGLNRHKQQWEELAHLDPLWSILSQPDRQHGAWEITEFFHSGEEWIDGVMEGISPLGHPRQRERALDFGCGVGRLTRALGKRLPASIHVVLWSAVLIKFLVPVGPLSIVSYEELQRAPDLADRADWAAADGLGMTAGPPASSVPTEDTANITSEAAAAAPMNWRSS